ncbi:hypothetical protein SCHPADRAFT_938123 [Schizopora paradoxa]|uniref:Zn(2)-C6 fungal-type domain-containing protein n=1 Tax=Schizopora paradoxa TaxID=27342 RepID=A0A0H2SGM5_9AGAM|nr:hypothetical protein SCHPADRAFT_938123 [Schizopora paradoxa]
MSYQQPVVNNRQQAAQNRCYDCCDHCRRDKKGCKGGTPCERCMKKGRICTRGAIGRREPLNQHVASMFGPTSFFISHNGGYFVIYSLPDGNTYVAELDGRYQVVGQSRFLGHQSVLASVPYNRDFTLDELLNPGLACACESYTRQYSGSSQGTLNPE